MLIRIQSRRLNVAFVFLIVHDSKESAGSVIQTDTESWVVYSTPFEVFDHRKTFGKPFHHNGCVPQFEGMPLSICGGQLNLSTGLLGAQGRGVIELASDLVHVHLEFIVLLNTGFRSRYSKIRKLHRLGG